MLARHEPEPERGQLASEVSGVSLERRSEMVTLFHEIERAQRTSYDRRRKRVREQIGS